MKRTEAEEILHEYSEKYFGDILDDCYNREGYMYKNIFAARGITQEDMYKLGLALALLSNFH